jgi:hypothetical protein
MNWFSEGSGLWTVGTKKPSHRWSQEAVAVWRLETN